MADIWMIFTISYPFFVISLHCFKELLRVKELHLCKEKKISIGKRKNLKKYIFSVLILVPVKSSMNFEDTQFNDLRFVPLSQCFSVYLNSILCFQKIEKCRDILWKNYYFCVTFVWNSIHLFVHSNCSLCIPLSYFRKLSVMLLNGSWFEYVNKIVFLLMFSFEITTYNKPQLWGAHTPKTF